MRGWPGVRVAVLMVVVAAGLGAAGGAAARSNAAVARSQAAGPARIRYDGRDGSVSYLASVFIARRAGVKSTFVIAFEQGRCSDGGVYGGTDGPYSRQGVKVTPSGVAAFRGYYRTAYWFTRTGRRVWGSERFDVLMHVTSTLVSGVLTDRFTSRRLRCSSGPVTFTAWRDGTPEAPFDTAYATTGRYSGKSDYGDSMSMNVFLPLGVATRIRVVLRTGQFCSGQIHATGPAVFIFTDVPIGASGFSVRGHRFWTRGGVHYRQRWSLVGNPVRAPRFDLVVSGWVGARRIGTCRTASGGDQFTLTPPHGRSV